MDDREARVIVGTIVAHWPHQSMPDSTVNAWVIQLRPFRFSEAQEAVTQLAAAERWMPAIADVIATIRRGWANIATPALGEPQGISMEEFVEQNPDWRERIDAFTKNATGRKEEVASLPVDRYQRLRADVALLDQPDSTHPRKRRDCTEHRFITHDRCFYCGEQA